MPDADASQPLWKDILSWVLKNSGSVAAFVKDVRGYFRMTDDPNERPILIIGPGGVGKTTLSHWLAGTFDWFSETVGRYEESLGTETTALHGSNPPVSVVTAPGQDHRRPVAWPDLLAEIAGGEYRGVILVSAFGHHSLRTREGYSDVPPHETAVARFLDPFLAARRQDELNVLRQLTPHLLVCRPRVWLLSVVAKQDLLTEGERDDAVRYYQSGDYAAAVAGLVAGKPGTEFRHETAFVSLIIRNYTDGRGQQLKRNVAGYDHQSQVASLLQLFKTVYALKAWEEAS